MPYVPVHNIPSAAVIDSEEKRKQPKGQPAQLPLYDQFYEPISDAEHAHRGTTPSQKPKPTEWQFNF